MSTSVPLSRRTANRDLILATKFVSTLSRSPEIRGLLMRAAGYTEKDHQIGWDRLHRVMGYRSGAVSTPEPLVQERALAELDAWDGPAFERARAAWRIEYPSQLAYVFEGLAAEDGPAVMRTVRTFVDRVAALRDGTDPHRSATREVDREAVGVLAHRLIIDEAIEAHLRDLLAKAAELAPALESPASDATDFDRAAIELHAWLTDWRGQARAVITRRDYLMRLGVASRRASAAAEDEEPVRISAAP